MKEQNITITQLNPDNFEFQNYIPSDEQLIATSDLDTVFSGDKDYIEYYVYDENQNKIYPSETLPLLSYNEKKGDVLLNPEQDLFQFGFDQGVYNILYSFYRKRLYSDIFNRYFIQEISSDRTEIRLDSNIILNEDILNSTSEFISYRETAEYFVDFYLNFGNNQTVIANNIKLDTTQEDPTILIKLYEPLPERFGVKTECWVVEELSSPQLYQVNFPYNIIIEDDFEFISGPNYNIEVKKETGKSSQQFTYNSLLGTPITSSANQLQNLLKTKEIEINVNYEDFSEFIHFSSAKTRLENFYYKIGLIESYTNIINDTLGTITSDTTESFAYSSSIATYQSKINEIIQNFDGYEYFLYFDSGSTYSWPKSNIEPPYTLYSTGSTEVLDWIGSANPEDPNFGGMALTASNYDQDNQNWLYWAIPDYLREDPENARYELFVDMIGQHYDNIWMYIKDVTNKFNADNRLDYGISKDLVADAIKDFGVKLYSNNFNINDLYSAFLGITPSGSLFPYLDQTGSLPTPSGFEYVDTLISASNDVIPLDDVNKRLYKRIYHNLPYLLKTKGTIAGLRALITSYGIPDTILRINEFGGKDKNNSQDWDLKQHIFNYAFDTGGGATNYLSSSLESSQDFNSEPPKTIQLRFKTPGIPKPINNIINSNIRYSQSLWSTDADGNLVLEYSGSGFVTESYSGSTYNPYDNYGTLKWIPAQSYNQSLSASVYLPFFNQDWWSIQININDVSSSLYAANKINEHIGFNASSSTSGYDYDEYINAEFGYLNKDVNIVLDSGDTYIPFSGSFQELRYWNEEISQPNFYDFVLNPYSIEGNGINSTPNQLTFRADLGTQLDLENRTSIHPRITGSQSQITQSFYEDSSFFINNIKWVTNKEDIYQDQTPSGIKNRITDKIQIENPTMPETPSGSNNEIQVLSQFQSIQQTPFASQSYTPDVNYLEVALSPQDQINDDINSQLGYFNIGEYIGDPRFISSSDRSYPDLDTLRDAYFNKYINSYDVVDFIRLIKFFDNSLFRMIKDFTPARTSLSSGIVVKQHLLERNRQRPAQALWSNHTYSGSIKPQSRNYNLGPGDIGQYEYNGGSSIYRFSGGTGGSFEHYNGLNTSPSASAYGLYNEFVLTQSFSESVDGPLGPKTSPIFNQEEFYDGEFSGSHIIATTQSLNPECKPYLKVVDTPISFRPLFFSTDDGINGGSTTLSSFIKRENTPLSGDAWIAYSFSGSVSKVTYIKLSSFDINGTFIRDYLEASDTIEILFPDITLPGNRVSTKFYIKGVTPYAGSVLLTIDNTKGDTNITGSSNGGSENWSLIARGNYTSSLAVTESSDNVQQGQFLNPNKLFQNQIFYYWNGALEDSQGLFNTGSDSITTSNILSDINYFGYGAYDVPRTSNIPWHFSLDIAYSSSDTTFTSGITSSGIFHSASKYSGVGLTDQSFTLSAGNISGIFAPSPLITNLESAFFTTTYNNLIPGNSGSGEIVAGHPQILNAGTASLDFYFPSLKISGTAPTPTISNQYTPFSGSSKNGSNGDFSTGISQDFNIGQMSSLSASLDGTFTFFTGGMETYVFDNPLQSKLVEEVTIHGIHFRIRYTFTSDAGNNITASIQSNDDLSQSWLTNTLTPTSGDGLGNWSYNQTNYLYFFNSGPGDGKYYVRPVIKSPEDSFTYTMTNYDIDLRFNTTTKYESESPIDETYTITNFFNSTGQNGTNNTMTPANTATTSYSTADIQVHLKVTGSDGERIITSSNILSDENIYGGALFTFPDSPILDIFNPTTASADTSSTITQTNDLYFIEYSMSNFIPGVGTGFTTVDVDFLQTGDTGSKILIEQRISEVNDGYNLTGSVYVAQGNIDNPVSEGDNIIVGQFIVPNNSTVGTLTLTGSFEYPFDSNDVFRMGTFVNKNYGSGLSITEYSMSIFPSSSVNAMLDLPPSFNNYKTASSTAFILPVYFGGDVLPFEKALDCQPLLNNYINNRLSTFLMDIDYTNILGSITPINQQQILDNIAVKASIPDSNYTSLKSINSRYLGSKSTSKYINKWAVGDKGTYGKLPTVELRNAYFGYFDSIEDPYPNLNDVIRLNLTYLVDQQGNALPPALEGISRDIFEKVFPLGTKGTLSISSGSKALKKLNSSYPLVDVGSYPTPIMYSQTSSNGYSSTIPISGSERISRYDNDNISGISHFTFDVIGTSSIENGGIPPQQSFEYIINPSEQINNIGADADYDGSTGKVTYDSGYESLGEDLTNFQKLNLQTSIPTSYIYDTNGTRDEMTLILSLVSGSTNIPFNFKDLQLKVHKTSGEYDLGSVIGQGWLNFVSPTSNNVHSTTDTPRLNSNNQIQITIDWEMRQLLIQKAGYISGKGDALYKDPNFLSLEWILTADSGDYIFKGKDEIYWKLEGSMKNTKTRQAIFFPEDHPNLFYTPAKISSIGALDHIFATDNSASAPYWVFGSQLSPQASTGNNVLYMSSSNMNEAYGTEYKQGDLTYIPGPSPYFPGGIEPLGTQFDKIEFPLEIKPGDEIRFANNENYSYTILEVTPPQNNIMSGVGRIKLILDKNVPGDVNKDFFLIRRYLLDANSIYMGITFPYINPPSSSTSPGILFPEYPTLELEASASSIVTSLISKGVIN